MTTQPNIEAAETFIWLNARLIDRHRYAFLFKGGTPEPVLAALLAYRNADGGFGHALEPDSRGWSSQPGYVLAALRILDEIGRCEGEVVTDALGYLESVTVPNGGVPVALASVNEAPKAPWWEVGADAHRRAAAHRIDRRTLAEERGGASLGRRRNGLLLGHADRPR